MQRSLWFDRQFSFDLSVWMYPSIVERASGAPARLEARVASLAREILIRREGESWSIQENAGHLLELEPLWMGRLDDFVAGVEILRPADLQNRKTHEANHNAKPIEELLASFRAARSEFVRRLDALDEAFIVQTALHPRLKTPGGPGLDLLRR